MQERSHEQTATTYYEPVTPHSRFNPITIVLSVLAFFLLILVILGAILDFNQTEIFSVALWQVTALMLLLLLVGGIPVTLYLHVQHKRRLKALELKHAEEDLRAKEIEVDTKEEQRQLAIEQRYMAKEAHEMQMYLAQTRLYADPNGNRPHIFNPRTYEVLEVASGNYQQPVPSHISIHHEYNDKSTINGAEQGQIGQGNTTGLALPKLEQFIAAIPFNSLQTGMGLAAGKNELVIADIGKSTHFKLIGGSDMGKSCVAAAMIDIATATNDPEHLQLGLLDLEYNTSRLFENAPHIAELGPKRERLIGRDANEVAFKLQLLYTELQRRERLGEAYCRQHLPLLLVYVEEMLALKYEVDKKLKQQMLEHINIMGVRARKYLIYFLAVMQTDYSDKDTREGMAQYRTRGGFAIDPDTARASGFFNTELIKENFQTGRKGQYVLEKPGFSGIVLAPDYDVKQKLLQLSGSTSRASYGSTTVVTETAQNAQNMLAESGSIVDSNFTTTGTLQAGLEGLSEQDKRILRKLRTMTPSAVIASEFSDRNGKPLKSGNEFIEKTKYIQSLIARFLPVVEG